MKRNYGIINVVIEVFTAKTWRPPYISPRHQMYDQHVNSFLGFNNQSLKV
jgi:hypothetical protein